MVALNSAMMTDGVVIEVADGAVVPLPLHIVHIASGAAPAAMFTRSLIRVGKHASATLVESYIGAEGAKAYQVHDSLIVAIGDGARLDHVRLIEDSREAFNISSAVVTLGANAHFNTFGMTSGAAVSRYQAVIAVRRRGLAGRDQRRQPAQRPPARRHHAGARSCGAALRSREVFRAVLDDRGHSVFQGKHHRPSRCAEDRRQDDDAGAAAVRRRRGRQQAGAGNFRRRRDLRSWRDHRRARRKPAVLSARARAFREGSPGAADPGVRRRGDRADRRRRACAKLAIIGRRSAGWRHGV